MDEEKKPQDGEPKAEAAPESDQPGEPAETSDSLGQASEEAGKALEPLQEGPALSLGFADFPVRILVAVGIFIAVFMVAWMVLWAIAGGLGLGLGWLIAAAVGALAVKVYADRAASPEARR
jgi:hypothetical protein